MQEITCTVHHTLPQHFSPAAAALPDNGLVFYVLTVAPREFPPGTKAFSAFCPGFGPKRSVRDRVALSMEHLPLRFMERDVLPPDDEE